MEVKNKSVRCVNRKTGEVVYNNAIYAYDKSWQKSTGNYPEPEPKAEDFKEIKEPISKDIEGAKETVTKEQKPNINAKTTEATKNDGRGNTTATTTTASANP